MHLYRLYENKNREQIAKIARAVRKKMERYTDTHGASDESLEGLCALASKVLRDALRKAGFKAEAITGTFNDDYHCWVVCNGMRFDITATQFRKYDEETGDSSEYPKVYITSNKGPESRLYRRATTGWRLEAGEEDDDEFWGPGLNPSVQNARKVDPKLYPIKRNKGGRFSRRK